MVTAEIHSTIIWGIWSTATNQANGSDMAISSMTMPDSRPESSSTLGRFLNVSLR